MQSTKRAPKKPAVKRTNKLQADLEVAEFLRKLKHPRKMDIEAVRKIILGVSPKISEGIKWNSPSFRTTEYFATLNLRKDQVWLILHFGAKTKDNSNEVKIADPSGLLKWLAKDRAVVIFSDAKDVTAKKSALQKIIREWIRYVV